MWQGSLLLRLPERPFRALPSGSLRKFLRGLSQFPLSFSAEPRWERPGRLTDSAARTDVVLLIRRTVRPRSSGEVPFQTARICLKSRVLEEAFGSKSSRPALSTCSPPLNSLRMPV